MQGKSLYINPGQGLYFSNKEKQISAFNHEQLSVVLTFGLYNLYFGIATLSPPADTTSYPSYISNPNYNDGHGNSNYTITQSVNTIVGCVINSINNSRFVITYVSQTSSNQIYVSWVNLTNGSYTLPTNISYVIWST